MRWLQANAELDQLLEQSLDERAGYLASLRRRDAALAADVEALLEEHRRPRRGGAPDPVIRRRNGANQRRGSSRRPTRSGPGRLPSDRARFWGRIESCARSAAAAWAPSTRRMRSRVAAASH